MVELFLFFFIRQALDKAFHSSIPEMMEMPEDACLFIKQHQSGSVECTPELPIILAEPHAFKRVPPHFGHFKVSEKGLRNS